MLKWPLLLQGSWEKWKNWEMLLAKQIQKTLTIQLCSHFPPSALCTSGVGMGVEVYVSFLPKQAVQRKLLTRWEICWGIKVFFIMVLILLALPNCFTYMPLFPKFGLRLLNTLPCSPGPSLPNTKASFGPRGWTQQCLTHLFLAPFCDLHPLTTILVPRNWTSEKHPLSLVQKGSFTKTQGRDPGGRKSCTGVIRSSPLCTSKLGEG